MQKIIISDERKRAARLLAEKSFFENAEKDGLNGPYAEHILANYNVTRAGLLNFVRKRRQNLSNELLLNDLNEMRRHDPKRNQPE
jgi:hypothetical protein